MNASIARRWLTAPLACTLLGAPRPGTGQAPDVTASDTAAFCCDAEYLLVSTVELLGLQVVPWYFNRHISDDSTAILSFRGWRRNIEQGFEWDPNSFATNLFMHPFHGAVFYNAARSNGYQYWQSTAFAWSGSFLWEFFGEDNRPAINDWVNTSMGGIVIGEAFTRTARMIRKNDATGAERAFRELGALIIDPVGGLNRLFRGEASRVGRDPDDRFPSRMSGVGAVGIRKVGRGNLNNGGTNGYLDLEMRYGNPFVDQDRPFDSFIMSVQLNTANESALGRLQIEGMLFVQDIAQSARARHAFGIAQHYDYIQNETYEMGGQSLSATLLSSVALSPEWTFGSRLQVSALVISGINSEFASATGRDYDFGSGAGVRLWGALYRSRRELLSVFYAGYWSHTLDGAAGDHLIHFLRARAQIPLVRGTGLGVDGIWAVRNSFYRDFPNVTRRNPQVRVFAAFLVR